MDPFKSGNDSVDDSQKEHNQKRLDFPSTGLGTLNQDNSQNKFTKSASNDYNQKVPNNNPSEIRNPFTFDTSWTFTKNHPNFFNDMPSNNNNNKPANKSLPENKNVRFVENSLNENSNNRADKVPNSFLKDSNQKISNNSPFGVKYPFPKDFSVPSANNNIWTKEVPSKEPHIEKPILDNPFDVPHDDDHFEPYANDQQNRFTNPWFNNSSENSKWPEKKSTWSEKKSTWPEKKSTWSEKKPARNDRISSENFQSDLSNFSIEPFEYHFPHEFPENSQQKPPIKLPPFDFKSFEIQAESSDNSPKISYRKGFHSTPSGSFIDFPKELLSCISETLDNQHKMPYVTFKSTDESIIYRNQLIALFQIFKKTGSKIFINHSFKTTEGKRQLLKLITSINLIENNKDIFPDHVFSICKQLFEDHQIIINNIDELLTRRSFLILLNILCDKKMPPNYDFKFDEEVNKEDFDREFTNLLSKYQQNVLNPFIDYAFFEEKYRIFIIIQIQSILKSFYGYQDPIIKFFKFYDNKIFGQCNSFSFQSFLNNDECLFVKLISLVLNKGRPILPSRSNSNSKRKIQIKNKIALHFLNQQRPGIIDINKSFTTFQDQFKLFKLIITKVIYHIDQDEILEKCKQIFNQFHIEINNIDELLTPKSFVVLSSILINHKLPSNTVSGTLSSYISSLSYSQQNDIFVDSIIFFSDQYKFLVLTQIHVLLQLYKKYEINSIMKFLGFYKPRYFEDCLYLSSKTFFDDGFHFPLLVSLICNKGKSILPPNSSIENEDDINKNNEIALRFLAEKSEGKININQSLKTIEDKNKVLELIITKVLLNVDNPEEIYIKCKNLFETYGVTINNVDDLLTDNSFAQLINILTFKTALDYHVDNIDKYIKTYNKFKIPVLFINTDSFKDKNRFLLFTQIYLILKFFEKDYTNPVLYCISQYLCKLRHNFLLTECVYLSSESFFSDQSHFPFLISCLHLNDIKDMNFPEKYNNRQALDILKKSRPDIFDKNIAFKTIEDKNKILELIITKIMYDFDPDLTIEICKDILKTYDISINNDNDIFTKKSFLSFFYIIANKKNPTEEDIDINKFDELIDLWKPRIQSEKDFIVFIKSCYFEDQYKYLILTQYHILIDLNSFYYKNPIIAYLKSHSDTFAKYDSFSLESLLKNNDFFASLKSYVLKFIQENDLKTQCDFSKDDKRQLLEFIITKIFNSIDQNKIFNTCKELFNPIEINNINKLYTKESFLLLLDILVNKKFSIEKIKSNFEFDSIINKFKSKLPLFINSSFFQEPYQFLILVQIKKILDQYGLFDFDQEGIFLKCKEIFETYNISLENINDLFTIKTFLSLLFVLKYQKAPTDNDIDPSNFDKLAYEKDKLTYWNSKSTTNWTNKLTYGNSKLTTNWTNKLTYGKEKNLNCYIDSTYFDYQRTHFILSQIKYILEHYKKTHVNPIIRFIHYFNNKCFEDCLTLTIDSFFNDQHHFPLFISLIFYNEEHCNENNKTALKTLSEKTGGLISSNYSLESTTDKNKLLELIITKVIHKVNQEQIFNKSKEILGEFNYSINSINDLLTKESILILFNVLCFKKAEIPDLKNQIDNFDNSIDNFSKAFKFPLFIKSDAFKDQYRFLLIVQIHIIFRLYGKIFGNPIITFLEFQYKHLEEFKTNYELTIDSFFNDQYHFPLLVSKCLCKKLPTNSNEKDKNKMALNFLSKSIPGVFDANQSLKTKHDKIKILESIITKIIYIIDQNKFEACKEIFEQNKIQIDNIDDLLTEKSLKPFIDDCKKLERTFYSNHLIRNHIQPRGYFVNPTFFKDKYRFLLKIQIDIFLPVKSNPIFTLFNDYFPKAISIFPTINTFFDDQFSFPTLISYIFNNGESILLSDSNAKTANQKCKNNKSALHFLSRKSKGIVDIHQPIKTTEDRLEILKIIITKILYKINPDEIFVKCKKLFESYNLPIEDGHVSNLNVIINNINDLLTIKSFIALLSIFTNKRVPYKYEYDEFDEMKEAFQSKHSRMKIYIESYNFTDEYKFLVLVQIHLLLKHFGLLDINPIMIFFKFHFKESFCDYLDLTIDSFFDDEYHFPLLISLIFNEGKSILPYKYIATNDTKDFGGNNIIALHLLSEKTGGLINSDKLLQTTEDKRKLLEFIITKIIYNINPKEILDKCREISNEKMFKNINELFIKESFLKLMCLLDKKYEEDISSDDFDEVLKNMDLFITSSCFEDPRYKFLVFVQIHVLLKDYGLLYANPIMKFLNYHYTNKFDHYLDLTIDSFFDDGYHFPFLVSMIFNNGKPIIPYKNCMCKDNQMALKIIIEKTEGYIDIDQSIEKTDDRIKLLEIIILKIIYNINPIKILNSCNDILYQGKKKITQMNDLLTKKSFLLLLYSLHNKPWPPNDKINSIDCGKKIYSFKTERIWDYHKQNMIDFDVEMKLFIEKDKDLPIFIDRSFFQEQYKFLVLTQIHLLLSYFSNKQQSALNPSELSNNKQNLNNQKSSDEKSNIESLYSNNSGGMKPTLHSKSYDQIHIQNNSNDKKLEYIKSVPEIKLEPLDDNDERKQFIEYQMKSNEALLKTINCLCSNLNLHFENFYQTVKKDSIPKFVMFMLNIKEIKRVSLETNNNDYKEKLTLTELNNIDAVIKFLKTKDLMFNTLKFNFRNDEFVESSAILFYTNFLNTFFLRQTKDELFNRCFSILHDKIKSNEFDQIKVLTKWNTYLLLAYYVNYGNIHLKKSELNQNENELFQKMNIPQLFDEQFLIQCSSLNKIPDVLYYQLQFIFNSLDMKDSKHGVFNMLPNLKHKTMKKKKIFYKSASSNLFDINENVLPSKFNERTRIYSLPIDDRNIKENVNQDNIESPDKFWNHLDSDYVFDNGILYNKIVYDSRSKNSENEWINEMKNIQNKEDNMSPGKLIVKIRTDENKTEKDKKKDKKENKKISEQFSINIHEEKTYKIFTYDEVEMKWIFNENSFINFCQSNLIVTEDVKTPLILFLNSFEENLFSITSKLIIYPHPKDNEQIHVYGFCDPYLPYFCDEEISKIKPIFLMLHIPANQQNRKDIKEIVFQVFSFLSYVSDIQIVILNKKYYKDQIDTIESIHNIYSKENQAAFTRKKSSLIEKLISEKEEEEFQNFDDDDNEEEVNEIVKEEEEEEENDKLNILKSCYADLSPNVFQRKSKIIVLANDSSVKQYDEHSDYLNQSFLFKKILKQIANNDILKFQLIDVNNVSTYQHFLTNLHEFIIESNTSFNDVLKNFKFIQMSAITNGYIHIKSQNKWEEELNKMISERYLMYKVNPNNNSVSIVSQIRKELSIITTQFDSEFIHKFNTILFKLEYKDDPSQVPISEELQISSNKHFAEMNLINDYEFLDSKKVDHFQKAHIQFLKDEFYNIISYVAKYLTHSKEKDFDYVHNIEYLDGQKENELFHFYYTTNIHILNEQIEKDMEKIFDTVKKVKLRYDEKEKLLNAENDEFIEMRNYVFKQNMKYKEQKMQLGIGCDMRDEILQDF